MLQKKITKEKKSLCKTTNIVLWTPLCFVDYFSVIPCFRSFILSCPSLPSLHLCLHISVSLRLCLSLGLSPQPCPGRLALAG